MSFIAAVDTRLPKFRCDVDRTSFGSVGEITIDQKAKKFATAGQIDNFSSERRLTMFAECVTGVNNVRHLFTGSDAISYEDVGFAHGSEAHQFIATTLTAVEVGLGPNLGRQLAAHAVTISEGPENGH